MRFDVSERWRISSDPYCWRVQQAAGTDKAGVAKWRSVKYFTSLGAAVRGLTELMLAESDARSPAEALGELARCAELIDAGLARLETSAELMLSRQVEAMLEARYAKYQNAPAIPRL